MTSDCPRSVPGNPCSRAEAYPPPGESSGGCADEAEPRRPAFSISAHQGEIADMRSSREAASHTAHPCSGRAADHETAGLAPQHFGAELGHGVHRADHALGHREKQRPRVVPVFDGQLQRAAYPCPGVQTVRRGPVRHLSQQRNHSLAPGSQPGGGCPAKTRPALHRGREHHPRPPLPRGTAVRPDAKPGPERSPKAGVSRRDPATAARSAAGDGSCSRCRARSARVPNRTHNRRFANSCRAGPFGARTESPPKQRRKRGSLPTEKTPESKDVAA